MRKRNRKFKILLRTTIWTLYIFGGIRIYSEIIYLPSLLVNFSRVVYPLSIFWLQIRLNNKEAWINISESMSTSQLWFKLLPIVASLISVIITFLNLFLYFQN